MTPEQKIELQNVIDRVDNSLIGCKIFYSAQKF